MQHIIVLLKYHSMALYVLLQLMLELLFEIEMIQSLPDFSVAGGYELTLRGTALTMLLAHWMYWTAGILGVPEMIKGGSDDPDHDSEELSSVGGPGSPSPSLNRRKSAVRDTMSEWAEHIQLSKRASQATISPHRAASQSKGVCMSLGV